MACDLFGHSRHLDHTSTAWNSINLCIPHFCLVKMRDNEYLHKELGRIFREVGCDFSDIVESRSVWEMKEMRSAKHSWSSLMTPRYLSVRVCGVSR